MELEFYIPRWGNRHLSWADFASKAKLAGYAGVEAGLPVDEEEQLDMFRQLKENGLRWIGQHFEQLPQILRRMFRNLKHDCML